VGIRRIRKMSRNWRRLKAKKDNPNTRCRGEEKPWNRKPVRFWSGIYALITPFLFSRAEDIYIPLHRTFGLSFFAFSLLQFLLIFLILLIPTTLMGATLPVLSRFFVRSMNTLGGQVGG